MKAILNLFASGIKYISYSFQTQYQQLLVLKATSQYLGKTISIPPATIEREENNDMVGRNK
jgi:hypothetical protein